MRLSESVSSKPLFDWFGQSKDNRAKLRSMGYSDGQITNWKSRGIPRGQIGRIAPMMGLTYEQYVMIAEAPTQPRKRLRRVVVLAMLALGINLTPVSHNTSPSAQTSFLHNNSTGYTYSAIRTALRNAVIGLAKLSGWIVQQRTRFA